MSRSDEFHEQTPDVVSYDKYLLNDTGLGLIYTHTYSDKAWNKLGKRVGSLSWFPGKPEVDEQGNFRDRGNINGGMIHKAYVSSQFRRKGIASAMLDFARSRYPDKHIRHSGALSDDGRAWAEKAP